MEAKQEREMDNKLPKIFNDSVHGHIEMPPLLVKIIDTPEFQRLRNIKQFGGGYYVYPGASHNRFEHSIGVAHLAGKLVQSLRAQEDLEISGTDELCVQIAGLCHDLGHGPFSHAFDEVIKELKKADKNRLDTEADKKTTTELEDKVCEHEARSVQMFEHLINVNGIKDIMKVDYGFEDRDFLFIMELIYGPDPPCKEKYDCTAFDQWEYKGRLKKKSFLYQIVANHTTGIDVDKMDYFSRDCHQLGMKSNFSHERYMKFVRVCTDNNKEKHICVRDKEALNMYELFQIRSIIRNNACHHRVATAIEHMMVDVFKVAGKHLKLGEKKLTILQAINYPETFANLTDDILQQILRSSEPELQKAKEIIKRIFKRDLYKFIGAKIFDPEKLKYLMKTDEEWKEKSKEKLMAWFGKVKEVSGNPQLTLSADEFKVVSINLDYGMKEKNPIDALRFYRKDDPNTAVQLSKDEVSYLLPEKFAETKVMVFYKGEDKAVENLTKHHIKEFWHYLDPVSAVVHNPSIYVNLTEIKPDLLQQIRDSAQEITEKFSKQGPYKVIAEKVFRAEELKNLGSDEQWKVKLKTWLENVQTSDQQPTFIADDFHVVQYAPLGKPDSVKVILLYKGLPNMDTEKFWDKVLKYLKDKKLISASERTITYVDLTEGRTPIIISLLLSAERHVTERLLNQGFFILDQKIFKAENLKHLGSEEWEVILKAWFNNPQNKTGSRYPARNAADFKLVTYPLLEQPDFINVMLFYKGIPKEKTEKFWDTLQKLSGDQEEAPPSKRPKC